MAHCDRSIVWRKQTLEIPYREMSQLACARYRKLPKRTLIHLSVEIHPRRSRRSIVLASTTSFWKRLSAMNSREWKNWRTAWKTRQNKCASRSLGFRVWLHDSEDVSLGVCAVCKIAYALNRVLLAHLFSTCLYDLLDVLVD